MTVANIPQKIQEAPKLMPGLELYYEAFLDLCASRMVTESGPQPVAFSEIHTWGLRYGLFGEEFELLALFTRRLDRAYIKYVNDKSKSRK